MPRRTRIVALAFIAVLSGPAARADDTYTQPLLFEWTTAKIDVLILPPGHGQIYNVNGPFAGDPASELHPYANSYMRAIEDSVADVRRALDAYASDWFLEALNLNVYVVGEDDIPQGALLDPDIVIATDINKVFALGLAVAFGPPYCLVLNSKFFVTSMTYEDMFNINAQEYMHCLGIHHINPNNEEPPPALLHDPMNGLYPHLPGLEIADLHCTSNLNVRGIEEAFRRQILGEPAQPAVIAASQYERIAACGAA